MPRVAIISWDHATGQIAVLAACSYNNESNTLEDAPGLPVEQMNKSLVRVAAGLHQSGPTMIPATDEGVARLARFLQRIQPVNTGTPFTPPPIDPSTMGVHVQRFLTPAGAKGSGREKLQQASYTDLLDIVANMPTPGGEDEGQD